MVAFVLLRLSSSLGFFNIFEPEVASAVFTIIIQIGIMFILPISLMLLIYKKGLKETFKFIGFKKISLNSVLIAIAIGFLAFFLNLVISTVFNGLIGFFGYNPAGDGSSVSYDTLFKLFKALFLVAVLPSIFEEIVHRGILLKGYSKEIGVRKALIYSSILFGLMHLNIGQVFYATAMGFLIGTTAIVSGSIIPAIIVHFMNNAMNVYLAYASQNQVIGQNFYNSINDFLQSSNPAFTFVASFLFLALLVFLTTYLLLKLFKESTVNKLENIKTKVEKTINTQIFTSEKQPEDEEIQAVNSVLTEKLKPFLPEIPKANSPVDVLVPKSKLDKYKPNILENLFFYSSVFLGVLVTLFTFIWGVV
jgi:membrane protease YdiL (CAAX protease family)